jgi:hypothetical protein
MCGDSAKAELGYVPLFSTEASFRDIKAQLEDQ